MKIKLVNKERSSDILEKKLIKGILEGEFPKGSTLPSERELASCYGVGRPSVREVLQRLEGGGWITRRTGLPATVNNFWEEGNMTTLVSMIEIEEAVTDHFIQHLLELRVSLAPTYIRDAVKVNQAKVVALLANLEDLDDEASDYAHFDWSLQKKLARLSPNPVYVLILNSLDSIYIKMAEQYFNVDEHRMMSRRYYFKLLELALKGNEKEVEQLVKKTMLQSLEVWKRNSSGG